MKNKFKIFIKKILISFKKQIIFSVVVIILAIFLVPNISYTIETLIDHNMTIPSDYKFLAKDHYKFTELNKGLFLLVLFLMSVMLITSKKSDYVEVYQKASKQGSHGTADFQTKDEIKENYAKDKIGWFLGSFDKKNTNYKIDMKAAYKPLNEKLNMQTIVIGSPGSQKTTGFILPNIFNLSYQFKDSEYKPDLIITDPKSELFTLTAKYLESLNYDVHVLDFIHFTYGDSINILDFIHNSISLREICKDFIHAMGEMETISGEMVFWSNQEYQILAAVTDLVIQRNKRDSKNPRTLAEVTRILQSDDVGDMEKAVTFFEREKIEGAGAFWWNNFLMWKKSEKTKDSILGGLGEKMNLFAHNEVCRMTQSTTIDLKKLGVKKEKPKAIFVFMPDGRNTFKPLINLFLNTMIDQMYKTAYNCNNSLEVPVFMLLDEFCSIGKIPNMVERLGTFRSRKIFPMMVIQSFAQLEGLYKDQWKNIDSQCDQKIYLGINDDFTARICSAALGKTTIKATNLSSDVSTDILNTSTKRESKSYQARELMTPDECRRIEDTKLIMTQRSRFPCILYKTQYKYFEKTFCNDYTLKDFKKLAKIIPELKKDLDKKDEDNNIEWDEVNKLLSKKYGRNIDVMNLDQFEKDNKKVSLEKKSNNEENKSSFVD